MPEKYIDKDGNEVEMPTKEELEAQQAEAIAKAKEEAKTEYESQIKAKEVEMQKLQDKLGNFEKLRNKTEVQEAEEKELKERLIKIESELKDTKESATLAVNEHFLNAEIDRIAAGDEKFKEQIKANINLFVNMPSKTSAEIIAKVKKAAINAQIDMGQVPNESILSGKSLSAAGGGSVKNESSSIDKEELTSLAKGFGITEETLKKRGKI